MQKSPSGRPASVGVGSSSLPPILLRVPLLLLLRHNSPTIKFTLLKCTMQWGLVYSQSCAAITTPSYRTFSSPRKETLYPFAIIPHYPTPSNLWQSLPTSVSLDLLVLHSSYKWNHTRSGLLWLVSFTEHPMCLFPCHHPDSTAPVAPSCQQGEGGEVQTLVWYRALFKLVASSLSCHLRTTQPAR